MHPAQQLSRLQASIIDNISCAIVLKKFKHIRLLSGSSGPSAQFECQWLRPVVLLLPSTTQHQILLGKALNSLA